MPSKLLEEAPGGLQPGPAEVCWWAGGRWRARGAKRAKTQRSVHALVVFTPETFFQVAPELCLAGPVPAQANKHQQGKLPTRLNKYQSQGCTSASNFTCHVPPSSDLQPQPARSQDASTPTPAPNASTRHLQHHAWLIRGWGTAQPKASPRCAPPAHPEAAAPGLSCGSCLGQAAAGALTAPQLPIKF